MKKAIRDVLLVVLSYWWHFFLVDNFIKEIEWVSQRKKELVFATIYN